MSLKNYALEYLSYGLNPVPVRPETKEPMRKGHSNTRIDEHEIEKYQWDAIGISTGSVSQGLEALDFDLKNAEDPDKILKDFKSKISSKLLKRLVSQKTPSGGFHVLYRCEDNIEGNRHLAENIEGQAIIETRSEGGFIVCAPSEGYELMLNDFSKIPIITPEERLELLVSAKMLNQNIKKEAEKRRGPVSEFFDKFPKYDSNIKIGLDLLQKHGWSLHSEDSEWVNLTRPGKDHGISAGYHKELGFLYVFSSSTNFEVQKPYNNHGLYAELECNGKYNVAYAKLYEQGYGADIDKKKLESMEWEEVLQNMEFVSTPEEEEEYLEQARKDEIPLGLPTGWAELDEYHRIKKNSLNMGIAYDGVGKSLFLNALAVATNTLHGLKWGMAVPENKTAVTRRRLMELKTGQEIKKFKENSDNYSKVKKWAFDNFKIVTNQKHYSLKDVIEMGKRMYEHYGIDVMLIDPYNFFKVEGRNGYSWNNDILSQLRVFADKYCSVYVMAHPSSDAPRKKKDAQGYLMPPAAYDIQGGADFPYRVDDFFILHRIKNHEDPEIRRTMQLIMHKVKEDETGGRVHSLGEYTELIYKKNHDFLGYWDNSGNNPMFEAMYPNGKQLPTGMGDNFNFQEDYDDLPF